MLLRIFPEPRYNTKQHTKIQKKDNEKKHKKHNKAYHKQTHHQKKIIQHYIEQKYIYIIYNNKKHTQTFSHKSSKKKIRKRHNKTI